MATSRKPEPAAQQPAEEPQAGAEPQSSPSAGEPGSVEPAAPDSGALAAAPGAADAGSAPEQEGEPPAPELVPGGVAVTFHGSAETIVGSLGTWKPEETRHVPKPVADQLCREGQALFSLAAE